jgi:hypothetical protein
MTPLTPEQSELAAVHCGLVPWVVSRMLRAGLVRAERSDLISAGDMALVMAAQRWQAKGKFTTYAYHAIHNQIITIYRLGNKRSGASAEREHDSGSEELTIWKPSHYALDAAIAQFELLAIVRPIRRGVIRRWGATPITTEADRIRRCLMRRGLYGAALELYSLSRSTDDSIHRHKNAKGAK